MARNCAKNKIDHDNKWYMYKVESILENERHTVFMDFEIQTGELIPVGRQRQVFINKKKKKNLLFR